MDNTEEGIKRKSRLAVFEHVTEKEKSPRRITFRANRLDLGDSSPSESELVVDDDKEKPVKKKKRVLVRLTEERLNLVCEWGFCEESFDSWEQINTHLTDHATTESVNFICQWKDCGLQTVDVPLLIQHVSYHGYLTKLKSIGRNKLDRNKWPECNLKENYTISAYPNGYTCEWEYCFLNFYTIYDFLTHMEIHIKNNPKKCKEKLGETIVCAWRGCNSKFPNQYKLAYHLRTHTKEKIMACPTCCSLFCSTTKFSDHRKKQLPSNLQSYQCSQCLKLFASERLLRDHMRCHINHYKCTMCDMTCTKPSILARHIRFRHLKDKPYKCSKCSRAFVVKQILDNHLKTHVKDNSFKCKQCDFKCRSMIGLENHYGRTHKKKLAKYECHCCKNKFKRGAYLTRHLKKRHNYHWPSGHSRFRYLKDKDGIHRLQTVRYESLEVTQEMIKSESMQSNNVSQGGSYNLKFDNEGQSKYVLSISENGEHCVKETEPEKDNILITITDVDEQGNIIKSQVVESGELIGAIDNKTDIEITEHPLSVIKFKDEDTDTGRTYEGKKTRKRKLKSVQNEESINDCIKLDDPKTEDIHHFSKRVILNYDIFKIETTKSEA